MEQESSKNTGSDQEKRLRSAPTRVLLDQKFIDTCPLLSKENPIQRYYDTLVPQLMMRIGQRDKPKFYVNFTDPTTKKSHSVFVAQWGDKVETKNRHGNIHITDITIEEIRFKAHAALAKIKSHTNENRSPILEEKRRIEADAKALAKGKTLRQAWNDYLQIRTRITDATSIHIYQSFRHLEDVIDTPLADWCTPAWLERRLIDISAGKSKFAHGGSRNVANHVADYLRAIINVVDADHTLLGANPASIALSRFKNSPTYIKPARKKSIIPASDLFELHEGLGRLAAAGDWLAHDFISLLLYTGIRENAASMIGWRDVNFEAGYCWIYVDTNLERQVILPLSDRALEILKARYERLKQHEDWVRIKKADWVFPVKYTYNKKTNEHITPQGNQVATLDNDGNPWSYVKETKRFFERLDIPTNVRVILQNEWRQPVKDASGRNIYLTLPDNPDAFIYKRATAHDFRRMVATFSKNYAGIASEYVEKLLTHRSESLLEGYIVDENDFMIKELRSCFNQLAEFIDEQKTFSVQKIEKLLSKKRHTKTSLPNGAFPTVPVERNKHTPKSKPSHKTTSHP